MSVVRGVATSTLLEFLPSDNGRSGDVDADLRAERVVGALVHELEALLALDARAFAARARAERLELARALDTFLANRSRETAVAPPGGGGSGGGGGADAPLVALDRLVLVLLVRIAQLPDADARADGGSPPLPPASAAQLLDVAALYGLAEPARAGEIITRALQRTPGLAAELVDALELVGTLLEHATEQAAAGATAASGLGDIRDVALTLHALAACAPAALGERLLPADGPPSALATALARCYECALAGDGAARDASARGVAREARAHVLLLFGRLVGGAAEGQDGGGRGRGGRGAGRGGRGAAAVAAVAVGARPNRALASVLSATFPSSARGGSALGADLARAFPAAMAASTASSGGGASSAPSADAVAQLLELVPGLGVGFAAAVLHHSGNDTQRAMNALFDEAALPAALAGLPRDLAAWSPAPPAPAPPAAALAAGAPAPPAASGRWQKSSAAQTRELLDARGSGADGRTLARSALARLAADGFDLYDDDFDDDADALPSSALAPSAAGALGGGGADAAADGEDGDEDGEGVRRGGTRRAPALGDDLSGGGKAAAASSSSVSGPRSVAEWLGALGLAADRYAPLLARAGCGRMELLPTLTDATLRAAGLTSERDRAKILAGARRLAERAGAARGGKGAVVVAAAGGKGAPADAAADDYFKSTRLHYDREQKGFWAEDGTEEPPKPEPARARASQPAAGDDDDDEGDDGPTDGGRGGRGGRGGGGGGGRGRGRGEASASGQGSLGGPRRNSRADHARKSHGQQSRAYAKQGRPQV